MPGLSREAGLCPLQAIGLIYGTRTAEHYHDHIAADPRIDALRAKMNMQESKQYEREYHDPKKRTNANSIQVFFKDGTKTPLSEVLYPLGHRKRREEGVPVLLKKFEGAVGKVFAAKRRDEIVAACADQKRFEALPVNRLMDLLGV